MHLCKCVRAYYTYVTIRMLVCVCMYLYACTIVCMHLFSIHDPSMHPSIHPFVWAFISSCHILHDLFPPRRVTPYNKELRPHDLNTLRVDATIYTFCTLEGVCWYSLIKHTLT